jgi:hypothetical protein
MPSLDLSIVQVIGLIGALQIYASPVQVEEN